MLVSLSLAQKPRRVGKETFLKMASMEQKRYLEAFPKSSHRYLLKKPRQVSPAEIKNADKPKKEKKVKPPIRRLSRLEYNALSEKDQRKYDKHYPRNSHAPRFKTSKKKQKDVVMDGGKSKQEQLAERKEYAAKVDKQRNVMHDEGVGVINKQSVQALAEIKPQHLQQGAVGIENNRDDIRDTVDKQLEAKPELASRGLAAVRDMMGGELLEGERVPDKDDDAEDAEFEEINDATDAAADDAKPEKKKKKKKKKKKHNRAHKDSKKQRDGHAVLGLIAKTALLGAGVTLLALGAGPLGMIVARGMLELWSDMQSLSATAKLSDDDSDTVDEILTQTVSYLKNYDVHDLQEQSETMFSALAGTTEDLYALSLKALLPVIERPRGRPGKNFFGKAHVTEQMLADRIVAAVKQSGFFKDYEHYVGNTDECHMIFCSDENRTLIVLAMDEETSIYQVVLLNW